MCVRHAACVYYSVQGGMSENKLAGAGAVLRRLTPTGEYQYMIVKNEKSQKFGLPKGRMDDVDHGSYEKCAIREVMEETGYRIELLPDHPFTDVFGRRYYHYPTYCRVNTRVDDEGTRCWQWLTRAQIMRIKRNKTNAGLKWLIRSTGFVTSGLSSSNANVSIHEPPQVGEENTDRH